MRIADTRTRATHTYGKSFRDLVRGFPRQCSRLLHVPGVLHLRLDLLKRQDRRRMVLGDPEEIRLFTLRHHFGRVGFLVLAEELGAEALGLVIGKVLRRVGVAKRLQARVIGDVVDVVKPR